MNRDNSNQYFQLKKWLAIALVALCIAASWMGTLDQKTDDYVDAAIVNATIVYGSARALNGAISVAQSTQAGINVGMKVSVQPLEILDPINDMVEDFATVMKFSISSLLIQKLLVGILANSIIKWLLLGLGAILITGLLCYNGSILNPLFKSFVFVSLIRFMFVIAIFLSSWADGAYLHEQTSEKVELIKQAARRVELVSTVDSKKTKLTSEELIETNRNIQELQTKKSILVEKIQSQESVVTIAKQKMQDDEEKLQDNGSIVERWNPLNKDKSIDDAENILDESTESYNKAKTIIGELKDQLDAIDSKLLKYQEKISGKSSIFSKIKDSAHSLLNLQKIQQSLKGSIDTMFHLIAIFVLKTMLMPIAFLYLTIRIFRMIWGIDPRTFFKGENHLVGEKKNVL